MSSVGGYIEQRAQEIVQQIATEASSRIARASNELQNSLNLVLSGGRSGRMYKGHQASAPGEPPANWHGTLRGSFTPEPKWDGMSGEAKIKSSLPKIPGYMQDGTPGGKIAPRPYREKVIEDAAPRVEAIMYAPY